MSSDPIGGSGSLAASFLQRPATSRGQELGLPAAPGAAGAPQSVSQAIPGATGHHHRHHHGGGGGLLSKIEQAVTSALDSAGSDSGSQDPNQVIQDAIQ